MRIQRITAYWSRNLEEKPLWEALQGRKTWTVIDELLEARCGQVWKLKMLGNPVTDGPHNIVTFDSRNTIRFSQGVSEKSLLIFVAGRRERNHFEINKSIPFFLAKSASGEAMVTEPELLEFLQSLTYLGRIPNSRSSAKPVPPKGKGGNEKHWWQSQSRAQPHKTWRLPCLTPYHYINKGLLTTVPFT